MAVTLKAGDVLLPKKGSSWEEMWNEVRLVSSHRLNNVTYWWVEMTDKGGRTHLDTLNYGTLASGSWDKKRRFYAIGGKYRFKNGNTRDVYEIIELHQVDRAIGPDHEVAAVAKCHDDFSGKYYLTVLNRSDFDYMQII